MSRSFKKRGLFVAGTDTGVGKTLVTAGLVRLARGKGLRALAVKPVETGCRLCDGVLYPEDGAFLQLAAEHDLSLDECAPFRFSLAASPERAAAMEGCRLLISDLEGHVHAVAEDADLTLVEGAGGLMVPVEERLMMIDLIERLGYPVLLVGRTKLGTINHTLLSADALKNRGLNIAGIVLSCSEAQAGPEEEFNPKDVARNVDGVPVVVLPNLDVQVAADPARIARTMMQAWSAQLLDRWIIG